MVRIPKVPRSEGLMRHKNLGRNMKFATEPIQIAWALVWRSVVFTPIALLFYFFAVGSWLARFALPLVFLPLVYAEDWFLLGIYLPGWVASVALWRWKRFRDLFEYPPSLL